MLGHQTLQGPKNDLDIFDKHYRLRGPNAATDRIHHNALSKRFHCARNSDRRHRRHDLACCLPANATVPASVQIQPDQRKRTATGEGYGIGWLLFFEDLKPGEFRSVVDAIPACGLGYDARLKMGTTIQFDFSSAPDDRRADASGARVQSKGHSRISAFEACLSWIADRRPGASPSNARTPRMSI
jgi:hypothetical protein